MTPFHQSYPSPKALDYFQEILAHGKTSGGGKFTKKVEELLSSQLSARVLLTNSCTSALEMAAHLLDLKPGDEVILPAYTFPSTANAFLLRGATIRWADSELEHPNMDLNHAFELVNSRTKAIVPMYYGGVSVDWKKLHSFVDSTNIKIIEEAAQSWGAFYNDQNTRYPLGTLGDAGVFSFHATKNVSAGEGGAFLSKHHNWIEKAEIIMEKGTNRSAFQRGDVAFYEWVEMGSSYVNSEWNAAYLLAQMEEYELQFQIRCERWKNYQEQLSFLKNYDIKIPEIPIYAEHNAHVFYLVMKSESEREKLRLYLLQNGVETLSHYRCLHTSQFYKNDFSTPTLKNASYFQNGLLRLPLHHETNVAQVIELVNKYFKK
jgi:dTDP-4-amino-4,6-dideoxygalactose transaminase